MPITFITGGIQSGKSALALEEAARYSGKRVFIATAEEGDEEMKARIQRHRDERGDGFTTVEEPFELRRSIQAHLDAAVIVVDCLSLWVSNWLTQKDEVDYEKKEKSFIDFLMEQLHEPGMPALILVSTEVGLGGIGADPLTRRYHDQLGALHQHVAAVADKCYLVVAGYPILFKGSPL